MISVVGGSCRLCYGRQWRSRGVGGMQDLRPLMHALVSEQEGQRQGEVREDGWRWRRRKGDGGIEDGYALRQVCRNGSQHRQAVLW